jgi:hypothetical protein
MGGSKLLCCCVAACLCALADAHSMMIKPKPRNAIDSELPEWSNGCAPTARLDRPFPVPPADAPPWSAPQESA